MRIAFATCAAMPDGTDDDRPAAAALGATFEVWTDPGVDWSAYDRVVVRSIWDYHQDVGAFVAWCRAVGAARLRNRPELIAFNVDKTYLADLAVPTVPTTFVAPGAALPHLDGELVVKPNVSAGARDTGRFGPDTHDEATALITRITASGRTALVQPYLAEVDQHGETAMVHFHGQLSHVLRKRAVLAADEVAPVADRGGLAVAAVMLDDDLVGPGSATDAELRLARQVLDEVAGRFGGPPLYARVDVLRGPSGTPVLLELEVTEPALYLAVAPGSLERFVAAVRSD
jgi:hypothetical protein